MPASAQIHSYTPFDVLRHNLYRKGGEEMSCSRENCACVALIVAILVGVAVGILYALGFVPTTVTLWAYLALGALSVLLTPIYAGEEGNCRCACRYRRWLLGAAVGTILTAAVSLLVTGIAGVVVASILVGVATLFAAFLLGITVCLTNCLCEN